MKEYDVIVLGGGLVGLMFVHLLVKHSALSVAVIERQKPGFEWAAESYDLRTSAISPASKALFSHLDLWDILSSQRRGCYSQMEVWNAEQFGRILFNADEIGLTQLGWIFENRILLKILFESLQSQKQVDFYFGYAETQNTYDNDVVVSFVDKNKTFEMKGHVLVGADGGQSWLRGQMHTPLNIWSYQQKAIVTNIETEKSHDWIARQRFRKEGPLAFLPLDKSHYVAVVWSCDTTLASRLLSMETDEFAKNLHHEMDGLYGNVRVLGERAAFPLQRIHSERYVSPRRVLIGDAAHVIHPLAGQGVNLGFLDAAALAEVIVEAKNQNLDIGHLLILRRYERRRKGHNKLTQRTMDHFYQIFGASRPSMQFLRGVGLESVHKLTSLKKEIMLHACGLKGDIPLFAKRYF